MKEEKSATQQENQFDFTEILPASHGSTINVTLRSAFVLSSIPPPLCQEVISHLKPFLISDKEFLHLKKCQRTSDNHLRILLGSSNELPDTLQNFLIENGVKYEIESVSVPAYPPVSKEHYRSCSPYWPVIYRRSSWEPLTMTLKIKSEWSKHLQSAIEVGKGCGSRRSGCVIVLNGTVCCTVGDKIETHPLQHASMVAIQNIAKKMCLSTGNVGNQCIPAEQYLLTGASVFLSHEPCIMCAMALLHSRVRVVVFAQQNSQHGGLGSQFYLHTSPKLNHRFHAFSLIIQTEKM